METDDRINELSKKIDQLSQDVETYRKEIDLLKDELKKSLSSNLYRTTQITTSTPVKESSENIENFVGLKLIHFVGIIVLIIGLTIGVKYAIDINLISPLIRIILAYVAGLVLFILSLRLRKNYELFSMILFSGAMASLYFTTYAAFEYYKLFPVIPAFSIMMALTCFTVYTSLKYNRQSIAILGLAGAYGIPFFVSNNSGNIIALFSYILIINAGILVISFKRYWLSLTYISFITTWFIFFAAILFANVQHNFVGEILFAFVFFLLFFINSLAYKFLKHQYVTNADTIVIVADTLMLYLALLLLYSSNYSVTVQIITLQFAIGYLVASILSKLYLSPQPNLTNSLLSLSMAAFIYYIALHFEGFTITVIWVVLAILIFIAGIISKMKILRIISIALFALTLIKLLFSDSENFTAMEKIIAYIFTGSILLIVSFLYQKFKHVIFTDVERER